jgi:CubicO group peptidase (beta-lactamase class C family)
MNKAGLGRSLKEGHVNRCWILIVVALVESALLAGVALDGRQDDARIEPPGRRFSYSNAAYLVLQQLLADVSGKPFHELAHTEHQDNAVTS